MDKEKFFERVSGIVDPARLGGKRVVVVGLGSGGSRVAVELGRLGIALLLIDRPGERLEEHNIVRHYLGYRSLGKRKPPELKRAIRNLNPSTPVAWLELDVVEEGHSFSTLLARWHPDVIAVCTDNEQSKHAINRAALRLGTAQVGAGVYDGGIGGEVYRIRPGSACYGCIAEELHLDRYTPPEKISPDYNHLQPVELPPSSALNLDIEQIASLQSRLILDLLLGENSGFLGLAPEVNLCVFSNRIVPGTFTRPFHGDFYQISKRPDCLDCEESGQDFEERAQEILTTLANPLSSAASAD